LAIQAAQTSTAGPVLLIDADVAQRNIANRFNINGSSGWCDILAGEADPQSCVQRQDIANLAIMGPGQINGHTAAAKTDAEPLHALKSEFGLVVVDLPDDVDSAAVPADFTWLDEAILVVEAERTRVQSAQHAKEALSRAGVHVKGVVLTNRREHIPHWLYQRL
jgi:MinD-like ATPase involved in chromosome partitioning or flagellar assembly